MPIVPSKSSVLYIDEARQLIKVSVYLQARDRDRCIHRYVYQVWLFRNVAADPLTLTAPSQRLRIFLFAVLPAAIFPGCTGIFSNPVGSVPTSGAR